MQREPSLLALDVSKKGPVSKRAEGRGQRSTERASIGLASHFWGAQGQAHDQDQDQG